MLLEVEPVELRARCAPGLRQKIKAAANESARSMSAEITYRLQKTFELDEARQAKSGT
jgi:hypothetical protein